MLHRIMDMQILLYAMAGMGILGILGMAATCLGYRRRLKKSGRILERKEKCLKFFDSRRVWRRRMNGWVWGPSFINALLLCLSVVFSKKVLHEGMVSSAYVQAGLAVPVALLVVRQALDLVHREDMVFYSMADYIEEACHKAADIRAAAATSREQEDAMVDYVAGGIKESTGEKGRFGELLSPEEEEIMREVIREFMG